MDGRYVDAARGRVRRVSVRAGRARHAALESPTRTLIRRLEPSASTAADEGFVLETVPPLCLPSLVPPGVPWTTVVDSDGRRLRVSRVVARGVRLFVNGVLLEEEANEHVGLLVRVEHAGDAPLTCLPDDVDVPGLRAFADHFLSPRAVDALATSGIAGAIAEGARAWRGEALWDATPLDEAAFVHMVRSLPDAFVVLLDPRRVPNDALGPSRAAPRAGGGAAAAAARRRVERQPARRHGRRLRRARGRRAAV